MKNAHWKLASVAVAATFAGMAGGAALFHAPLADAQAATTPSQVPPPPPRVSGPAVPGSVQVTRLTDTTFVVVKDEGDAEVVTLFSTEGGLIQKKHSGRFFY